MSERHDTVRELCDVIRIPRLDLFKTYGDLSDRILAAHEREMAAKDAEIAWLKAALKPVRERRQMKELLRIYNKVDGDVLAIILSALSEYDFKCEVEVDGENGCLVIKET